MTPRDKIRSSVLFTQRQGIKTIRGPWFVRGDSNEVTCACALGSVLLAGGCDWTEGAISTLCCFLDVDAYWIRRFWLGWDRGYQVLIEQRDGSYTKDEVSEMAIGLAEELV